MGWATRLRNASVIVPMLFIGAAVVSAQSPETTGVTPNTIKIGVFGPLTGSASLWGYPINNGAIALYEEANAKGGINGRKVEIVHEGDGCDPAKAVAAVKKLIHRDKVFMIHGGTCSAAVFAAREEIIANKVPFVVMAATLDKISTPVEPYVFTTTMPGSGDGATMARFIDSIPNAKRVAIVKHADEWADTKMAPLLAGLKGKAEVVTTEQIDRRVTDATAQVLKVKERKPDVTVVIAYPAETAVFLRDAKKYQLGGHFIGTSSVMDMLDLAQRAGGLETVQNLAVVSFLADPPGTPAAKPYEDIYKKYFPNDRVQTLTFFGMSGALLAIDALKRAGATLTRDSFLGALNNTRDLNAGPAACKITITKESHQGCLTGTMWAVRSDKVINIGPVWKKGD
jgi:branched-chain amino acid transport system substrate-binding protein